MRSLYKSTLLLCVLLSYCREESTLRAPVHERLTRFHSEWVYTMDDIAKMEERRYRKIVSKDFNRETDTIKYQHGKIYVSYLRVAAGCAAYYGDLSFRGDTIRLLLLNKDDVVCAEQDIHRVVYEIDNKDGKKYVLEKY